MFIKYYSACVKKVRQQKCSCNLCLSKAVNFSLIFEGMKRDACAL